MLDGTKYFQFFPDEILESDPAASGAKLPARPMSSALRAALYALEIEFQTILQPQLSNQNDHAE
jgi:hypothetical protein